MFTQQELSNILVLINKATLTGAEALTVAQLQVKINQLLNDTKNTEGVQSGEQEGKTPKQAKSN